MKTYWNILNKYRKSKNPKISYIIKKLNLFIFYSKCGQKYEQNI